MPAPVGIIAGGGDFPRRLAEAVQASGRPVFVVVVKEFADPAEYAHIPHEAVRLGAGGQIIAALKSAGVRQLALCGRARRPSLLSLVPDAWTARALARIGRAALAGDDTTLRAVATVLEEEGFEVVAPSVLHAQAMPGPGLLAGPVPDALARHDICRAIAILRALAPHDVGQACVVQQGLVLGIEAIEGTDALIARCGAERREGPGGVLVKLAKPQQDSRLDLPTIGPATIAACIQAGLRGIAIEAGRTVVAEAEATRSAAEAAGLFLLSLDPEAFLKESAS
ncbi:MAG: UDP-2,3-diacylglucosamine diphosphatase LpxI [Rhodovarius sp.]|nr:UDP-2,3-diacylglucosamine diphosphatase LpxI [Rhodovarius sp.]MCX7931764.1 UDP-2,3-diacylglucosamine diphosphatase LpxI [Rhodovarius sp.]MDW8314463.1 UDP-2,3-diacylglucosamine diphosphatase LpxI [Rhodovarius sp.]